MTNTILGIDCGAHGALALLSKSGKILEIHDMPTIELKVGKTRRHRVVPGLLAELIRQLKPAQAVVEKLHGMPGMGGTTMFALGYAAGVVEGVLATLNVPIQLVTPQAWKKAMRVTKDKGICRQRAIALWPEHAAQFARIKDDGRAESCLIGLYGATFANLL